MWFSHRTSCSGSVAVQHLTLVHWHGRVKAVAHGHGCSLCARGHLIVLRRAHGKLSGTLWRGHCLKEIFWHLCGSALFTLAQRFAFPCHFHFWFSLHTCINRRSIQTCMSQRRPWRHGLNNVVGRRGFLPSIRRFKHLYITRDLCCANICAYGLAAASARMRDCIWRCAMSCVHKSCGSKPAPYAGSGGGNSRAFSALLMTARCFNGFALLLLAKQV